MPRSQKKDNKSYFSYKSMLNYFDLYDKKRKHFNDKEDNINSNIFELIIKEIQERNDENKSFSDITDKIFRAIDYQIQPFISKASPFGDRFKYIQDIIDDRIQMEILEKENSQKEKSKYISNFICKNHEKKNNFLVKNAFEIFFENKDEIENFDAESLEYLLDKLNLLFRDSDFKNSQLLSSNIMSNFLDFLIKLTKMKKHEHNDNLKAKVVSFLLNISFIFGGINCIIGALDIAIKANPNFNCNIPLSLLNIVIQENKKEFENINLIGKKLNFEIDDKIISACESNDKNILLLSNNALYNIDNNNKLNKKQDINVSNECFITVNNMNSIYIFDDHTKSLTIINNDKSCENIIISFKVQCKVIGITYFRLLFFLVEENSCEFFLIGLDIENNSIEIKERITTSLKPKFIFTMLSSVCIYFSSNDPILSCCLNENKFKHFKYILNSVIDNDDSIIISSNNISCSISQNGKKLRIMKFPLKYGNVLPLPNFVKTVDEPNLTTFQGFIEEVLKKITFSLLLCTGKISHIFTLPTRYLQYFCGSQRETIEYALNLGNNILENNTISLRIRRKIIYFSLLLLIINVYCYSSNFSYLFNKIGENDFELFNRIRNFIEVLIISKISTSKIIAAAFKLIKTSFHLLYFPNFFRIKDLINKFKGKPKLLASTLPFLFSSSALFYIDDEIINILKQYLPQQIIFQIFICHIKDISLEFKILKLNNIVYQHEKYIAKFISSIMNYFTELVIFPELISLKQQSLSIIFQIMSRIIVLDSVPNVSISFGLCCLNFFQKIQNNFTQTSTDLINDKKYSSILSENETTQLRVEYFETSHNYEDNKDIEKRIEIPYASEIQIEFDPRCATEPNSDYLQIYDRSEGGSLIMKNISGKAGSQNWPKKLTIQSDSCRFFFHADESNNDWGICCKVSGYVPVEVKKFSPNYLLIMLNLICYLIGRSVQQGLISIPVVEKEKEFKFLLESELLKDLSIIKKFNIKEFEDLYNKLIDFNSKTEKSTNENCNLKYQDDYSSLIESLTSFNFEEKNNGYLLLHEIYNDQHKPRIKPFPLSLLVERFAFAALIQQLGLLELATTISMEINQYYMNPKGEIKPQIPGVIMKLYTVLYRIRTTLYFSYQKSKLQNLNQNKLRENYHDFTREMLLKCKFLIESNRPLVSNGTISNSYIDLVSSFIVSDIRFEEIKMLILLKEKRAKIRMASMDIIYSFFDSPQTFNTTKISFLSSLLKTFPKITGNNSIKSFSSTITQEYEIRFEKIQDLFIEKMTDSSMQNALRLFLLKYLLFLKINNQDELYHTKSMISFALEFQPSTIDEICFVENIWLYVLNIVLNGKNSDLFNYFHELLQNINDVLIKSKIVLLETIFIYKNWCINCNIQFYYELLNNNSPPILFINVLNFISMFYYHYGIDIKKTINFLSKEYSYYELFRIFLMFIGFSQIHEDNPFYNHKLKIESQQLISNEIISFFRILTNKQSKANEQLQLFFDNFLSEIASTENIFENKEKLLQIVGFFLIFSYGNQPLIQGGYGIVTCGPNKNDLMKITSYLPMSDIVLGTIISKSFDTIQIKSKNIISSSRIQPDPHNLNFKEEHFNLFQLIHHKSLEFFKTFNLRNNVLIYTLITSFYCFITLVIQTQETISYFLSTANLDSWLKLSIEETHETLLHNIPEILLKLNDSIHNLSLYEEEISKIMQQEKKQNQKNEFSNEITFNNSYLHFSILPIELIDFSPYKMFLISGYGKNINNFTVSVKYRAVFVGDRPVPSSQFYWEVTIHTSNPNPSFSIGFLDYCFNDNSYQEYSYNVGSNELISPITNPYKFEENFKFNSGDYYGIGLSKNNIYILRNGIYIGKSIQCPHLSQYTPFISISNTDMSFDYNFGHSQFKSNFFEQITHKENQNQKGSRKRIPFSTKSQGIILPAEATINLPILVSRIRLPPKDIFPNEKLSLSDGMKLKLGKIGIVKEIKFKNIGYSALIDFYETEIGCSNSYEYDGRFLSTIPLRNHNTNNIFNDPIIHTNYLFKLSSNNMNSILKPTLLELSALTHLISVRMSRYTMLMIFDFIKDKDLNFNNKDIVKLLSILIIELSCFSPSNKPKWSNANNNFLSFKDSSIIFATDISKMLIILRSIMSSFYQDKTKSSLIQSFFDNSLDIFLNSNKDLPIEIVKEVPSAYIYEANDSFNRFSIDKTICGQNVIGYIPIVICDSRLSFKINVENNIITGKFDDIALIEASTINVNGELSLFKVNGFKIVFLPIYKNLSDSDLKLLNGSIHLMNYLLNLFFSDKIIENSYIINYFKTTLLLSLMKILKNDGVFGKIFVSDFIISLLANLQWNENDFTSEIIDLYDKYFKKYEYCVTSWKQLNTSPQKAVLLKIFFDFVIFDSKTHDILYMKEPTKEDKQYYYKILKQKLNQKNNCIFLEIVNEFSLVISLTHGWNYHIKFPSYLLFKPFIKLMQRDPIVINNYNKFFFADDYAFLEITIIEALSVSVTFDGIDNICFTYDGNEIIPKKNEKILQINSSYFSIKIPNNLTRFKITININELSQKSKEDLFFNNFNDFSKMCQFMENNWKQKIDENLVKIINQSPDILKMNNRLQFIEKQISSNFILRDIPLSLLSLRIDLINDFNLIINQLLKCVDLSKSKVLSQVVIAARSSIMTSYKLELFRRKIMVHLNEYQLLNLKFNRSRAALHMINPKHINASTLLKQFIDQVPIRSFQALKRDSVPWHVELIGEGATDAGGPARDLFTQMCMEIMHNSTGLFVITPNKRNMIGPNQEVLIPNSNSYSSIKQQMFIYSGLLIAIAFVSRIPQPFRFADFVWAYFTGKNLTIEDIYSVDTLFEKLMKEIENGEIDDIEAEKRGLTFTVMDSHSNSVELFTGGRGVRVTQDRLLEYSQLCKKYRLKEMKRQLDWLKEGISYFFPNDAIALLSPWELELIICGDNTIPINELKKHCKYDSKDPSSQMLWEVLENFSSEERMLFIKFATGCMGLPPPGTKWHNDLTIKWVQTNNDDDKSKPLPTASTCSSIIRIPRYSTKKYMSKKILAAITFGVDIDTDRHVNFSDIVPLS